MTVTITGEGPVPLGGLSAERLQLIGKVAVAHSFLEFAALLILANLIHDDATRGIALAAGDPLRMLLDRTVRLVNGPRFDLPTETRTRILQWVGHVEKIKDERNRVLHSMWVMGTNEDSTVRVRLKDGAVHMDEVSAEELKSIAEALELLVGGGFELVAFLRVGTDEPIDIDPDVLAGSD